jgi:hypothetical protein
MLREWVGLRLWPDGAADQIVLESSSMIIRWASGTAADEIVGADPDGR